MIKKIYIKNKEIINYLIFGILTTIINLISYYTLTNTILNPNNKIELQIANIISWILAVLFAYITNKIYVFNSHKKNIKEILNFLSSRIITLILDMVLMYILVSLFHLNDQIIKLIITIIVVIINYILSKIFVFKK